MSRAAKSGPPPDPAPSPEAPYPPVTGAVRDLCTEARTRAPANDGRVPAPRRDG